MDATQSQSVPFANAGVADICSLTCALVDCHGSNYAGILEALC